MDQSMNYSSARAYSIHVHEGGQYMNEVSVETILYRRKIKV